MTDLASLAITLAQAPAGKPLTALWIIVGYMALLMVLGGASTFFFRGTSKDYFVASRSIGPFLLLMSVFGTTMTGFALVGSSAKSFEHGIGVYGLMASWSGLIHSAVFFLVGIRLWAIGKRYNYMTQVQFFRDRFNSESIGYLLFPILVALVIPYLLVGIIAACKTMLPITRGMFPEMFASTNGAVPPWLTGLVVCGVVLFYVFFGGVRSAAWANTFQTVVFMIMGVVTFYMISDALGGLKSATQTVLDSPAGAHTAREGLIGQPHFFSYLLIPLSVGMFPHLFQHWLTARSAKTFRLTVVAHPLFIAIVWVPCVLVGMWAAGQFAAGNLAMPTTQPGELVISSPEQQKKGFSMTDGLIKAKPNGQPVMVEAKPAEGADETGEKKMVPVPAEGKKVVANGALGRMVAFLVANPVLIGLLTAGILAAIMSSLDSQFVCLGTMFTNDIVVRMTSKDRFSDKQLVWISRIFVVGVVALSYALSMALLNTNVFDLGVWCFSGFASLFPLVFAAIYWKRTTRAGAFACVIVTVLTWLAFFIDDIFLKQDAVLGSVHGGEYLVAGVMPVTFIFLASVVTLVVVSLLTKPLPSETVDRFFFSKTSK